MEKKRIFSLDLLRVVACYMVIQVHAGEFFYIGEGGSIINGDNAFWVNAYNSLCRIAVPLFVFITGYFVLPVKESTSTFLKKRFTRVLIPFVVWCILYAWYSYFMGKSELIDVFKNILNIPVNYGVQVGHLWYIYMLLGLYLFFPIISPWLEKASRKDLHLYLSIWAFTTFLPYIHLIYPDVLGECFWNPTPMLYYFSGFLGIAILGFYMRKFHDKATNWDEPLGLLLIIGGYIITYKGFADRLNSESWVWDLELTWGFGTINIAMMTLGFFLLLKNVKCENNLVTKIISSISNMSFGMYLIHIMVLNFFYFIFDGMFESAAIKIPLMAIPTFIVSYLIIKLISLLPKSKYIIG